MKPDSRMIASTDPDDDTCEATFTVGNYDPVVMRMKNADYFKVHALLSAAWRQGIDDGKSHLAHIINRDIREWL